MNGRNPLIAIALLCTFAAPFALAQGTTGALVGKVIHDGAPLQGVTITINSPAMQGARVTVSNVNGDYRFPPLPPGEYEVTFEMQGMSSNTHTTTVALAATARVNTEMRSAAVMEEMTVTAALPTVVETTEIQSNYDARLIDNLPIGRDVGAAVYLSPGVTSSPSGNVLGGGFAYDSLLLVNGAVGGLRVPDAIQETTVMRGAISAEFGRFTGGVVSAITKSGGNEFSGSLRNTLTNFAWSSLRPGEVEQPSELNQSWEATLGGRVVRDRLWFFTAGAYREQDAFWDFMYSDDPGPQWGNTFEQVEIKLTGQLGSNHSLVGSFVSQEEAVASSCYQGMCWEPSVMDLDGNRVPQEMVTANYNGILTSEVLVEAGYSTKETRYVGTGGSHVTTDYTDPRDIALGSWGRDLSYGGWWGAPVFCGVCGDVVQENESYNLKGTYYMATRRSGTHNVVAGYESFVQSDLVNNYQSASLLEVYVYSRIPPSRVGPASEPGSLRPVVSYGDVIWYTPIENLSIGSDRRTDSLFVNDKWDLNSKWSFNVGIRYDGDDSRDSAGNPIAGGSRINPRLGVIYDIRGDGRLRVNASYSGYTSEIQGGNVGDRAGGGFPSFYGYEYTGPTVGGPDSGLGSFDVLEQVFAWLLAQGWSPVTPTAPPTFFFAFVPHINQNYPGDLKPPSVDELTVGFGMQLGNKGFLRVDLIDKQWTDFYIATTTPGDTVEGSAGTLDVHTYANCSSCYERTHQSVQLQGSYRFSDRLTLGGNYTWSEAKGDYRGEARGYGVYPEEALMYPEYKNFEQHNPTGFMPSDQTHRARLWLSYDQPLGSFGRLNVSLLEAIESGLPYEAALNIPVWPYVENPGYADPPNTVMYYFSDRGEYRWGTTTSTNLALTYSVPIGPVSLFLQGDLTNVFDEQAQTSGNTTVRQLGPFDPFNETPVEGVHWEKSSSFGKATRPYHYQAPRSYQFSVGLRF